MVRPFFVRFCKNGNTVESLLEHIAGESAHTRSWFPVKQVQITCPFEKTEAVFDYLLDVLNVKNVMKVSADNAHMLLFRIPDGSISDTLDKLKKQGVGVEFGFIDILDLKASLPRDSEETDESKIERHAELAVEEIYDNVKKGASLAFDFIAFVVLAAVIAGLGLIQNNATVIVASMLLSPLMGPMLGVALGYVVNDKKLFFKGTFNELIALALSFTVGAILGILMPLLYVNPAGLSLVQQVELDVATEVATEITRRGGFSPLDVGIAIFSGAAVAVSVTRGDMSALVGVAISASLMPPAVNVGMMIALGLIGSSNVCISIGVGSLALLAMNIIVIDIAAIVMFRVKQLTPLADKSATWKAVTAFKKTRSRSLYHAVPLSPPKLEDEQPAATFKTTPEPAAPSTPTSTTEAEDKSEESEKS
jgi:uncharacterized hydrophobic protein (TIGR00341 family)